MKIRGKEFIDVLENVSALEWYRYSLVDSDRGIIVAPSVVWRFDFLKTDVAHAEHIISIIISIIRSVLLEFKGNVRWSLEYTGRNWVLSPTKTKEMEESGQFRTYIEIRLQLFKDDPEFGPKAHEDLAKIAEMLAQRLKLPS